MSSVTPEIAQINTIHDLANCVVNWHQAKLAGLEHLLQIPEGTTVQVNDETSVTLTDTALAAFKVGILTAICELDELPFSSDEVVDEPHPASQMDPHFEKVH